MLRYSLLFFSTATIVWVMLNHFIGFYYVKMGINSLLNKSTLMLRRALSSQIARLRCWNDRHIQCRSKHWCHKVVIVNHFKSYWSANHTLIVCLYVYGFLKDVFFSLSLFMDLSGWLISLGFLLFLCQVKELLSEREWCCQTGIIGSHWSMTASFPVALAMLVWMSPEFLTGIRWC